MLERNQSWVLMAFAVLLWVSGPVWANGPQKREETVSDPVLQACLDSHGARGACECVAREARSRFSSKQRAILAAAMPDIERVGEPQELVDELGLSLDEILNLRRRVSRADTVIRNACGIGFDAQTGAAQPHSPEPTPN